MHVKTLCFSTFTSNACKICNNPFTVARNFQSPPKKKVILKILSSIVIISKSLASWQISLNPLINSSYDSDTFIIAMVWFPATDRALVPSSNIVKATFNPLAILVPSPVSYIRIVLGRSAFSFVFSKRDLIW